MDLISNLSSLTSKSIPSGLHSIKQLSNQNALSVSENTTNSIFPCQVLSTENGEFIDSYGRIVTLKGINLDSMSKLPANPDIPSYAEDSEDPNGIFFDGDNVSFVGRPFPLEEAEHHFRRVKSWGYNTIRYIITWEAIEHEGPNKYDKEFLEYTVEILKVAHRIGGLYILLELHQDVWSRFSGGSGAPMWTFYAAGLEPKRFASTEAAILHNNRRFKDNTYPKMLWVSNYRRLASLVMFTLFFSGETFFPELQINNQNIQHYLQDKFFGAQKVLWQHIVKSLPEMVNDGTLLGFESMNEPNCGLIGTKHLDVLPDFQQLRLDTTPTVFQAIKLGSGLPCEVDTYKISITGPQKSGVKIVDPKGQSAWLSPSELEAIDSKYGWVRTNWKAGCIFKEKGIWHMKPVDSSATLAERLIASRSSKLAKPDFFYNQRNVEMDINYFINHQFVDFFKRHKEVIRSITPEAFIFIQTPVLETPPILKGSTLVDNKTVYTPHFYDGMSLMFKCWNTKYNVDTLGIMRGRYLNPILGLVVGERAIRNCLRKQFIDMKKECKDNIGNIPVLMSETGMPFDMDDKRAYKSGRYYSQTGSLDAISYALEGAQMHHTYWTYCSRNNHKWGDLWNNEDFSFWSSDDRQDGGPYEFETPKRLKIKDSLKSVKKSVPTPGRRLSVKLEKSSMAPTTSSNMAESTSGSGSITGSVASGDRTLSTKISSQFDGIKSLPCSLIKSTLPKLQMGHIEKCYPSPDGVRAPSAVIRPFAVATKGDQISSSFDLKKVTYILKLQLSSSDNDGVPSLIFVPKWHFPYLDAGDVYVSSGRVEYNEELEYIEWFHDEEEDHSGSKLLKTETLMIKNNSGLVDEENPALFPCAGELSCPVN